MFGDRLSQLRKEKGITQLELSKVLKVSSSTISMYERNERDPDTSTLLDLADYFDVSADYLLGRTDNPKAAILKGEDLPDEIKEAGIKEVAILKEFKDAGLNQEEIQEIIDWYKWKKEKSKSK